MAGHLFSALCRRVIIDEATHTPSLIDVMEGIEYKTIGKAVETTANELTVLPMEMALISMWTRDERDIPERTRIRIWIEPPNSGKEPPKPLEIDIDLTNSRNHRQIVNFQGLQYFGDGEYVFHIAQQHGDTWKVVASPMLLVKPAAAATPPKTSAN